MSRPPAVSTAPAGYRLDPVCAHGAAALLVHRLLHEVLGVVALAVGSLDGDLAELAVGLVDGDLRARLATDLAHVEPILPMTPPAKAASISNVMRTFAAAAAAAAVRVAAPRGRRVPRRGSRDGVAAGPSPSSPWKYPPLHVGGVDETQGILRGDRGVRRDSRGASSRPSAPPAPRRPSRKSR